MEIEKKKISNQVKSYRFLVFEIEKLLDIFGRSEMRSLSSHINDGSYHKFKEDKMFLNLPKYSQRNLIFKFKKIMMV